MCKISLCNEQKRNCIFFVMLNGIWKADVYVRCVQFSFCFFSYKIQFYPCYFFTPCLITFHWNYLSFLYFFFFSFTVHEHFELFYNLLEYIRMEAVKKFNIQQKKEDIGELDSCDMTLKWVLLEISFKNCRKKINEIVFSFGHLSKI